MRASRSLLIVLCVMFALVGCKSGQAPTETTEKPDVRATRLPMAVPDKTFALARMNLAKLKRGTDYLASVKGEDGGEGAEVREPARMLVASLLQDPSRVESRVMRGVEVPDGHLPGLDASGTMYLALSTSGNERLLRTLRNSVPDLGQDALPRGFFVRAFLPADEPETLSAWIESACEDKTYDCDVYERVTDVEDGVIVDMRPGSMYEYVERKDVDIDLPSPADDSEFFSQRTVSTAAFTESDAVLGVYLRSDRLTEVAAVLSMTDAMRALTHVSPGNKPAVFHRGMQLAGGMLRAENPESREVYDSATFVDVGESGLVVDSVLGLTELGAKVAEAGRTNVKMSSVGLEDPLVEATYVQDLSAAMEPAVSPEWLVISESNSPSDVAGYARDSGGWLQFIAFHNYPFGYLRGLSQLVAESQSGTAAMVGQMRYLNGVRISVSVEPSDDSPLGVVPSGAVIAHFDSRAKIEGIVERLQALGGNAPFAVESTVDEREDGKELRILLGDVDVTGSEQVASSMNATLDMEQLRAVLDQLDGVDARELQMASLVVEAASELSFETQRVAAGTNVRMTLGTTELAPIAMPEGVEPADVADAEPDCLASVRRASKTQLERLDRLDRDDWSQEMVGFAEELEAKQGNCSVAADEIEWIRARWLASAGDVYADGLMFDRAERVYARACELGDESACEAAKRAESLELPVRVAEVTTDVSSWSTRAGPFTVVTTEDVRIWRIKGESDDDKERRRSLESIDWDNRVQRDEIEKMLVGSSGNGIPLLVDGAADAYALAVLGMGASELLQSEGRVLARSPEAYRLVIPVAVDGQDGLGELVYMPSTNEKPDLIVDLSTSGVFASVPGEMKRKKVGQLEDVLDGLKLGASPKVRIQVGRGVPFDRVASISATLKAEIAGDVDIELWPH